MPNNEGNKIADVKMLIAENIVKETCTRIKSNSTTCAKCPKPHCTCVVDHRPYILKIVTLVLTTSILFLNLSKCSIVVDKKTQYGIHVSDYCPKMEFCAEGAHVMCMYYNPDKPLGPRCHNAQNLTITPDMAKELLDVSNAVRSKIALGKEKGTGGNFLPRGYGIFRLSWDSELATFAQVLANQCVLRHDMCRASKRFPEPGQTAGLVRFTHPDWFPVSKSIEFKEPGLTKEKLKYATTQTLKSWYGQKDSVNADMILNYPDWVKQPDNQAGRLYLEMIHGPATHMGCGVSAYTEYAYQDNFADLSYNSVQVICNYASRPRRGDHVYNITPPTGPDSTPRCGCPIGSIEDSDCLCIESPSSHRRSCDEGNCDPTVVLLPIFSMEDAPPRKIIERLGHNNESILDDSMDIFHAYEINSNINPNSYESRVERTRITHDIPTTNMENRKQLSTISRKGSNNGQFQKPAYNNMQIKKTSIEPMKKTTFAKSNTFDIPNRRNNINSIRNRLNNFSLRNNIGHIKDVKPRKDFSNVQTLVDSYINNRNDFEEINDKNELDRNAFDFKDKIYTKSNFDQTKLHHTKKLNNRIKSNLLSTKRSHYYDFNITSQEIRHNMGLESKTEDKEKKLLHLVDTLEQEVNHIELSRNTKELLDEKIRKIYAAIVLKPVAMTVHKDYLSDKAKKNKYRSMISDDIERRMYENEERIKELKSDDYDKQSDVQLPQSVTSGIRIQNMIAPVKETNYERNVPKTIGDVVKSWDHNKISSDTDSDYLVAHKTDENKQYKGTDYEFEKRNYGRNEKEIERNIHQNFMSEPNNGLKFRRTDSENRHIKPYQSKDDVLGEERRRYYQEKLDKIERTINGIQSFKRHSEYNTDRHMKPVRPNTKIRPRQTDNQISSMYMHDRARFLHGF